MLDIIKKAALRAGEIQKKYFRSTKLTITHKTDHQNIVTQADKKSQEVIIETILSEMKQKGIGESDIGFIGEEDVSLDSNPLTIEGAHQFIIDPIDGTSSFSTGIDYFCCAIAYVKDDKLQAGCIHRPITDQMYYAEKGMGAYLQTKNDRKKLNVRDIPSQDLMIFTEIFKSFSEPHVQVIEQLMPKYRSVHINGAIALDIAMVAENICGFAMVDTGPWIWDLAAAKIILEEAGGGLYDWKGNELKLDFTTRNKQYPVLACHPKRRASITKYTQRY